MCCLGITAKALLCCQFTFLVDLYNFKTNRIKAVLKIFKYSSVLKHTLVFWHLPVILFSVTTEGHSLRTIVSIISESN